METRKFWEFCKDKPLYMIMENGWYYSDPLFLTEDKQEAINYWEGLSQCKYSNYEDYVKRAHEDEVKYYSFVTQTYGDFINKMIDSALTNAHEEIVKEATEKGNQMIADKAAWKERRRSEEIAMGLVYYLNERYGGLTLGSHKSRKKYFEKHKPEGR